MSLLMVVLARFASQTTASDIYGVDDAKEPGWSYRMRGGL
jgi:hypothetical protein